jgi:hypothetical protein
MHSLLLTVTHRSSLLGGRTNDLYCYIPAAVQWVAILPSGSAPSPRSGLVMVATPDGMVYIFGGYGGPCEGKHMALDYYRSRKHLGMPICVIGSERKCVEVCLARIFR